MLGRPSPRKGPLFWEYGRDDSYLRPKLEHDQSPNSAVRDGRWKLLMNADGTDIELYDLDADPKESVSLSEKQPEVTGRLSKRLLEWRREVVWRSAEKGRSQKAVGRSVGVGNRASASPSAF